MERMGSAKYQSQAASVWMGGRLTAGASVYTADATSF